MKKVGEIGNYYIGKDDLVTRDVKESSSQTVKSAINFKYNSIYSEFNVNSGEELYTDIPQCLATLSMHALNGYDFDLNCSDPYIADEFINNTKRIIAGSVTTNFIISVSYILGKMISRVREEYNDTRMEKDIVGMINDRLENSLCNVNINDLHYELVKAICFKNCWDIGEKEEDNLFLYFTSILDHYIQRLYSEMANTLSFTLTSNNQDHCDCTAAYKACIENFDVAFASSYLLILNEFKVFYENVCNVCFVSNANIRKLLNYRNSRD